MDWIQGIQAAIDYVEAHITEEIRYEEVAKRAYASPFHFQRVFGILCGFSLEDYIWMRRPRSFLSFTAFRRRAHRRSRRLHR